MINTPTTGNKLTTVDEVKAAYDSLTVTATTSSDGLMSSSDKIKLNGIDDGAQVNSVTGVKGDTEQSYRVGNINLDADDVGAIPKTVIDLNSAFGGFNSDSGLKTQIQNAANYIGSLKSGIIRFQITYDDSQILNKYETYSGLLAVTVSGSTNYFSCLVMSQTGKIVKIYKSGPSYEVTIQVLQ